MRSLEIKVHPLVLAAIIGLGLPSVAIAAGTMLNPPVTVSGATSSSALLSSFNTGKGEAIFAASKTGGPALQARAVLNAVYATSTGKHGVDAETYFNSTSLQNAASGVFGTDLSKSGTFNSGVRGVSSVGIGVSGSSANGNGIVGDTSFISDSEKNKKAGVMGIDLTTVAAGTFNAGLIGISSVGDGGVYGIGTMADGVYGTTAYPSGSNFAGAGGLLGQDLSGDGGHGDFGAAGVSNLGTGVLGASQGFVSVEGAPPFTRYWVNDGQGGYLQTGVIGAGQFGVAAFGIAQPSTNYPALYVQSFNGSLLIRAAGTAGEAMSLDNGGNMILKGTLTQNGTPLDQHETRRGRKVAAYGCQTTSPSIEDFGSAQLIGGRTYVRLDAVFAETINSSSNYLVFITPEGSSRGLFVAGKSSNGFWVRENGNGSSSVFFDYRIVARPYDSDSRRLPEGRTMSRPASGQYRIDVKHRRLRV